MKAVATAALLLLAVCCARSASADVVELRSGERVEGRFKGADDAAVRIEVDGRLVTFPPAAVRAIYYGPPPASRAEPIAERHDALGALAAVRSIARPGVAYQDYAPRVAEARRLVESYLRKEDGAPALKGAIAESLHYYALAGTAWSAGLGRGNYAAVGTDPALARCEPAQRVIAESKKKSPFVWRAKGAGESATAGMVIATADDGIAALWTCAGDRLALAESLGPAPAK